VPEVIATIESSETSTLRSLIEEIKQIRGLVPSLLVELEQYRKLTPSVLKQIEESRQSLPQIQQTLGTMRATVSEASATLQSSLPVVKSISEQVPGVLAEVKATRSSIPIYLKQAEQIVETAQNFGKESGKGIVSGLVSGIVTLPVDLFSDLVSSEKIELTKRDRGYMKASSLRLLNSGHKGESRSWKNSKSGNSGEIKVVGVDPARSCKELGLTFKNKSRSNDSINVLVCKDSAGEWKVSR
jgi:surface antigen